MPKGKGNARDQQGDQDREMRPGDEPEPGAGTPEDVLDDEDLLDDDEDLDEELDLDDFEVVGLDEDEEGEDESTD